MSTEIAAIAKKYMSNPLEITIGTKNSSAENISHAYYIVHAKDKYKVLKRIADSEPYIYAIVFCRTRRDTQEVASKLINDGYDADALHGDLSQAQRDNVMQKFRSRNIRLLVATDVQPGDWMSMILLMLLISAFLTIRKFIPTGAEEQEGQGKMEYPFHSFT